LGGSLFARLGSAKPDERDGKAPQAVQPSPNPLDSGSLPAAGLPLPHAMEPQINPSGRGPAAADVTQNLTYLNHALKSNDWTAKIYVHICLYNIIL